MFEEIGNKIATGFSNFFLGWIPDWFWYGLSLWPWIVGFLAVCMAITAFWRIYIIGGWPAVVGALVALATLGGFVLGRKSVKTKVIVKQAAPAKTKPATKQKIRPGKHPTVFKPNPNNRTGPEKKQPTIFDLDGDGIPNRKE